MSTLEAFEKEVGFMLIAVLWKTLFKGKWMFVIQINYALSTFQIL